jgi:hypothetical protein
MAAALGAVVALLAATLLVAAPVAPAGADALKPAPADPYDRWVAQPAVPDAVAMAVTGDELILGEADGSIRTTSVGASTSTLLGSIGERPQLVRADGTMVVVLGASATRLWALPVGGGTPVSMAIPPTAKVSDMAVRGGRVWLLDGYWGRLGAVTVTPSGFGTLSWKTLGGHPDHVAAGPFGDAAVTWVNANEVLNVQRATAASSITLGPVLYQISPEGTGAIAIGDDDAVYSEGGSGLAQIETDGTRRGVTPSITIGVLAAGPGVILVGDGASGFADSQQVWLFHIADGRLTQLHTSRWNPNEGTADWSTSLAMLGATADGHVCAGPADDLECTTDPGLPTATVFTHETFTVDGGVPHLDLTISVVPKQYGLPVPTGTVVVDDVRSVPKDAVENPLGALHPLEVRRQSAPLVNGVARFVFDDIPDKTGTPYLYHQRNLIPSYSGDANYAPNSDTGYLDSVLYPVPYGLWLASAYSYLMHRMVDHGAWDYWNPKLAASTPRLAIATALGSSTEARTQRVAAAYQEILGRAVDLGGLAAGLAQLAKGRSIADLRVGLAGSHEAFTRAGGTNGGAVTALFEDFLGRAPTSDRLAYWSGRLAAGSTTRAALANALQISREGARWAITHRLLAGASVSSLWTSLTEGTLYAGQTEEAAIASLLAAPSFQTTTD